VPPLVDMTDSGFGVGVHSQLPCSDGSQRSDEQTSNVSINIETCVGALGYGKEPPP
jgi:hypothetical protein